MSQKKHKKDALYGRKLLALGCLAPYNAKIYRNFENEEKKIKTSRKQKKIKYCTSIKMFGFKIMPYVNVWIQNNALCILAKKTNL
jgi:hypothetical protein